MARNSPTPSSMPRASAGHVAPPVHDWAALIAAKDREIDRLEGIYRDLLTDSGVSLYRRPRPPRRSAHRRDRRQALHRRHHPDRHRRPSGDAGDPRHRARHHLERGARSAGTAAAHRHRRRRLHRRRVRRHLPGAGRRGDARHPRRGAAARLRRRHPRLPWRRSCAQRGIDIRARTAGRAHREAARRLRSPYRAWRRALGRSRDVRDRPRPTRAVSASSEAGVALQRAGAVAGRRVVAHQRCRTSMPWAT